MASRPCSLMVAARLLGDEVDRLGPVDLVPGVGRAVAPDGSAQPVGIGVDVGDRDALGADVPARQRVVRVALHAGDGAVLDGEHEAADGLAQVADADLLGVSAGICGSSHADTPSEVWCRR